MTTSVYPPRKPPAKRLFTGLAGSPLAQVDEPVSPSAAVVSESETSDDKVIARDFLEFLSDRDLTLEAAKQLPPETQKELKNQFFKDAQKSTHTAETISERLFERIKELLFGDLAYCVKHDSYEPCDVCAQNTINVQKLKDEEERIRRQAEAARRATHTVPPTAEIPVPLPKARGRPAGSKNLKLTELERKEEEARRGRERRKQERERRAAIKEALRTPVAEVKLTEEKKKRNAEIEEQIKKTFSDDRPDMDRGMSMPDAPSGKGQLVTNVDLDAREKANAQAELLGMPDEDGWPVPDRRIVRPEGTRPDVWDRQTERGTDK